MINILSKETKELSLKQVLKDKKFREYKEKKYTLPLQKSKNNFSNLFLKHFQKYTDLSLSCNPNIRGFQVYKLSPNNKKVLILTLKISFSHTNSHLVCNKIICHIPQTNFDIEWELSKLSFLNSILKNILKEQNKILKKANSIIKVINKLETVELPKLKNLQKKSIDNFIQKINFKFNKYFKYILKKEGFKFLPNSNVQYQPLNSVKIENITSINLIQHSPKSMFSLSFKTSENYEYTYNTFSLNGFISEMFPKYLKELKNSNKLLKLRVDLKKIWDSEITIED